MKSAGKLARSFTQIKEFTKMALWITSIALVGVALRTFVQNSAVDSSVQDRPVTTELR